MALLLLPSTAFDTAKHDTKLVGDKQATSMCRHTSADIVGVRHYFDSRDELKEYLLSVIQPEDVLLLKGSNGMKMKEISEEIQKKA